MSTRKPMDSLDTLSVVLGRSRDYVRSGMTEAFGVGPRFVRML
jgi:hypothetical protein